MNKTKHKGGKIYGEGNKGYVQDNRCIYKDPKTFCMFIDNTISFIEKITLYNTVSKKYIIDDVTKIQNILSEIVSNKNVVVKTFKGDEPKEQFFNEINANHRILKYLPNPLYHTIKPVISYKLKPIYALSIHYIDGTQSKNVSYHIFSEGCSTQILDYKFTQQSFNKFVKDIKSALDSVHSRKFFHNDIKPANMIYCANSDRFKVIDWELGAVLPKKPYKWTETGGKFFCHPLKLYLAGTPNMIARRMMSLYVLYGKETWVKNLKSFPTLKKLTAFSFDYILDNYGNLSTIELQQKFGPYFDNWGLAISIILLADKNKVKAPKDIVNELLEPFMPNLTGSHS